MLLLFLAPILFPGTIEQKIKTLANNSINGEINFSKTRLSFFTHFPSLTLTLHNFTLKGSSPYKEDTLVQANEISLGINLASLVFNKHIKINKIFIYNAVIKVLVNKKGEANYNVYIPAKKNAAANNSDTSATALKLEKIIIDKSHFIYNDLSTDILIDAKGFNYTGNGDLSKAVFDLKSHAKIDSLDFYFDKQSYLLNKKVNADLITRINTNSFAFFFQKNDLLINKLPVQFSGNLDFLQNGYEMDLKVSAEKSDLDNLITALPPQFIGWQQKATIKGNTDFLLTLKGKYIASTNTMPDLAFNMKIREGYIAYQGAPFPVSNLFLNLQTSLPALNQDSLKIKVDSIFFNINKDYLSAVLDTKGVHEPFINAKVNAVMDLEKMDKAFGLPLVELKGKTEVHLALKGRYTSGPNPKSMRHENIVLTIPLFNLQASVKDGYFKYDSLPVPVTGINFTLNSSCTDNDYHNLGFSIDNLSATALKSFIKGHASVNSLKQLAVDANLQSDINLDDIKNIYPFNQAELAGNLKVNINSKGRFDAGKKTFPVTTADILLQNGVVKTMYYPNPITNIDVTAKVTNATGVLSGTTVAISPASFLFEGKPFQLQATLQNLDNIGYDIKAKGTIDIARIYKVFTQKRKDISGFIKADVALQGRQSDAMAGRYNKLNNQGTLEIKDMKVSAEEFPQPFFINEGLFTFKQDKMWFRRFKASYGQSDFMMDGYLQNVINYALSDKAVLKGNFSIHSNLLNVDEFMAFAPVKNNADTVVAKFAALTEKGFAGVILIPANLSVSFTAAARKVLYNGLILQNATSTVAVNDAKLSLQKTGFTLIGCTVQMDALYGSVNPQKAFFETHLQANDFDIKKAYDEIKLFHDMATAAGSAQGIVSLDYTLKGKLDGSMQPVYPSLEGGGVVSVKKIQMKNYKLLSAVASKTGKDGIKNPDISKIDIKSTIKNNVITIERFKIKTAGVRLRMEGKTNFDGALKMKMRLGLPPLGIIGIPLRVTGTQTDPKIKVGKSDKDEVQETEYDDEDADKKATEKKN